MARFVVIDRKITQGTRGQAGRSWCERIWTVLATCAQRGRSAYLFPAKDTQCILRGTHASHSAIQLLVARAQSSLSISTLPTDCTCLPAVSPLKSQRNTRVTLRAHESRERRPVEQAPIVIVRSGRTRPSRHFSLAWKPRFAQGILPIAAGVFGCGQVVPRTPAVLFRNALSILRFRG